MKHGPQFLWPILRCALGLLAVGFLLRQAGFALGGSSRLQTDTQSAPAILQWEETTLSEDDETTVAAPDEMAALVQAAGEDQTLHSLTIDVGGGSLTLQEGEQFSAEGAVLDQSGLESGDWAIDCGLGKATVTLPKGTVVGQLDLEVGLGSATVDLFRVEDCDLEVGAGSLQLWGEITGRAVLDCGMGRMELHCLRQPDTGWQVNVDMGSVTVGDFTYSGVSSASIENTNMQNFYEIDCGMGTVSVQFLEERP